MSETVKTEVRTTRIIATTKKGVKRRRHSTHLVLLLRPLLRQLAPAVEAEQLVAEELQELEVLAVQQWQQEQWWVLVSPQPASLNLAPE